MKKSLAALLVAGLAASAGAQAQTTVNLYGLVDAYVGGFRNSAGPNRGTGVQINSGGMSTSYFGMNGTEDLGGGLKAVFALEAFLRPDTGAFGRFNGGDTAFSRNAFVGMAGPFGQFTIGRNTNPYFLSTILFNPFVDSFTFSPIVSHVFLGGNNSQGRVTPGGVLGNVVDGDTAFSNSIRYTSPTFGGLRADVVYAASTATVLGQESPTRSQFGRAVDAGLFYGAGPFAATAVYRTIDLKDGTVNGRDQNSYLLGASYDLKVAKLFAQYNDSRNNFVTGPDTKRRTYQLGVSVPVGSGAILASWADSRFTQTGLSNKRDTFAIGYDYNFSRRTDTYLVYYRDAMKDVVNNTGSVLALGLRHRF